MAEELENAAFEACGSPDGEDDFAGVGDEDYGSANAGNNGASLPKSQLFHFYSPIKWAKVVKLEYQLVSKSPDSDVDEGAEALYQDSHDDEDLSSVTVVDQFPVQNFELVYQGTNCSISTKLKASFCSFAFHLISKSLNANFFSQLINGFSESHDNVYLYYFPNLHSSCTSNKHIYCKPTSRPIY